MRTSFRGANPAQTHTTLPAGSQSAFATERKKTNAAHLTSTQATAKARWGIGLGEVEATLRGLAALDHKHF